MLLETTDGEKADAPGSIAVEQQNRMGGLRAKRIAESEPDGHPGPLT
jgi:hypothetical protein